ncbi:MAG TPA: 7-carboxy-7-deazaguanine synthase QueE [Bacteroidia bacterium]|nr:7-carboxy-7-deazaguanine synthase QueE [Bacteroidia bacterium]
MEDFYSLQGEGFHTGKPAYFIRIGGCDVGCHWCDVKESWDANVHPLTGLEALITKVKASRSPAVVITGGEPLIYNMNALCSALQSENIQTHLETSGSYALSGVWDWICLSPKKTLKPLPSIYTKAHELKVIVYNRHDFTWAEEQARLVNTECHLFLQPEWSRHEKLMPEIIDFVKNHPRWRISLQAHKYMHIP